MTLSFQLLKILTCILLTLMLLICFPDKARAEWTEWLADTELSYTYQDNINHSMFSAAEESDHTWKALISAGRVYQLGENTRFFASALVDGSVHHKFGKLNHLTPGVSLAAQHKFGIGPYQPWIRGSVTTSHIFSRSRIRKGQTVTAGLDVGKALHERLDIALSYRFDYRNSDNSQTIAANKLLAAGIDPGISSAVYDIKGHSIGIQFNALLTQQWLLLVAYNFRSGDIVSSNEPGLIPNINSIVDAIDFDDALPGWAYRSDGNTHRYSVDANYAFLKGHAAFNVGYEYIESHASQFTYRNNLLRVNFNYRF